MSAGRAVAFPPRRSTTFYDEMRHEGRKASTIASAIEINRPVNLTKCLRALETCDGVVRRSDRSGNSGRESASRCRGHGLRTGQRGQRRGCATAAAGRCDRTRRSRRLRPDGSCPEGSQCHGRLSHDRSVAVQRGIGQHEASDARRSPIGPWRSPMTWMPSSRRFSCMRSPLFGSTPLLTPSSRQGPRGNRTRTQTNA